MRIPHVINNYECWCLSSTLINFLHFFTDQITYATLYLDHIPSWTEFLSVCFAGARFCNHKVFLQPPHPWVTVAAAALGLPPGLLKMLRGDGPCCGGNFISSGGPKACLNSLSSSYSSMLVAALQTAPPFPLIS